MCTAFTKHCGSEACTALDLSRVAQAALADMTWHAQGRVHMLYVQGQGCSEVTWWVKTARNTLIPYMFDLELRCYHCIFGSIQLYNFFCKFTHPIPNGVETHSLRNSVLHRFTKTGSIKHPPSFMKNVIMCWWDCSADKGTCHQAPWPEFNPWGLCTR